MMNLNKGKQQGRREREKRKLDTKHILALNDNSQLELSKLTDDYVRDLM